VAASVHSSSLQEKLRPYFTGWWMDRYYPFHLSARFSDGVTVDAYISKFKTDDDIAPFGRREISGDERTCIGLAAYDNRSRTIRIDNELSMTYDDFPEELPASFYGCEKSEWESKGFDDVEMHGDDIRSALSHYEIDYGYVPDGMIRLYDLPVNCIVFDGSLSMPLNDSRINIYYNEGTDEFSYQMRNTRNLEEVITDLRGRTEWYFSEDHGHFLSKSRGCLVFPSSYYEYVSADGLAKGGGMSFFEIGDENVRMRSEGSEYGLDISDGSEIVGLSLKRIRRV
jgi:hypothetical protein